MPTRVPSSFVMFLVAACVVVAPARALRPARAQETAPAAQDSLAQPAEPSNVVSRVSARLERGGRVSVDNFTTGRIRIVGWEKETVEATATSERGSEAIKIRIEDRPEGRRIFLDTSYSDEGDFGLTGEGKLRPPARVGDKLRLPLPSASDGKVPPPAAPHAPPKKTQIPDGGEPPKTAAPPNASATPAEAVAPVKAVPFIRRPEIHIEVRVPRYAQLEPLRVFRSPVEITGVETPVRVVGDRSEIRLKDVGGAFVKTQSGRVSIEEARADVVVLTVSGGIRISDVRGAVRAQTLSGAVEVACVSGSVLAGSAEGPVALAGVGGDVDANTTGGPLRLAGAVREGGSYRLKSITGLVELALAGRAPGFTVTLSSYTGSVETDRAVETDISLQIQEDTTGAETNRRRVGRHGDGRAQISLDSFEGTVRLTRAAPNAKACER